MVSASNGTLTTCVIVPIPRTVDGSVVEVSRPKLHFNCRGNTVPLNAFILVMPLHFLLSFTISINYSICSSTVD